MAHELLEHVGNRGVEATTQRAPVAAKGVGHELELREVCAQTRGTANGG